ncbi:oligosaccharide flippase family protein [Candidatus Peregrinibacteria bacterium]|nr:oligosaccharide flippase family protein [Candidatus Peregrinibacteria bacterium]
MLGPEEYGVFALLSSLTAFGTVFASVGAGYLVAAHYPVIKDEEKKKMVASILAFGLGIAIIFSFIVILLWPAIGNQWAAFSSIPKLALFLSLISMVLSVTWTLSIDVITMDGKAKLFASVLISQSIINAAAIVFGLYGLKIGMLSLFAGSVAGSAILFIGALFALWPYLGGFMSWQWVKRILRLTVATLPANLLENLQTFVERSVLSINVGIAQLGLYTHSQQYRSLAMMTVKAAARTVQPLTLEEARSEDLLFPKTKQTWDAMYIVLTFGGLLSVTVGREIISLLTNGKFADAYVFVVFWMIYLLIQNAGKPHTGVFLAFDRGPAYARIQIATYIIGLILLVLLVPILGISGAFISIFAQMTIFRVCIQIKVKEYKKVPFQDGWIIFGIAFILLAFLISWGLKLNLIYNLILLLVMTSLLLFFARSIVKDAMSIILKNITV